MFLWEVPKFKEAKSEDLAGHCKSIIEEFIELNSPLEIELSDEIHDEILNK